MSKRRLCIAGCCFALGGILFLGLGVWKTIQPESSGKFEMVGEFSSASYSGSLQVGAGEDFNTWQFSLIVPQEEFERVDQLYSWMRRSGPMEIEQRPGYVLYGRESTGNWCGDLPVPGDMVKIDSPSGYTRDVVITNLTRGITYKSQGSCSRPVLLFHYRVTVRATGEILLSGDAQGRDTFEVLEPTLMAYLDNPEYLVQIWQDGQEAPPEYQPE
jgi:hypothetical protein